MNEIDRGRAVLKRRASLANYAIMIYLATEVASLLSNLLIQSGVAGTDDDSSFALSVGLVIFSAPLMLIVSAILIGMWIHRAHANLFAARLGGLEYTPGWSVGWFFVPFANLVKPFRAMRELYNRSLALDDSYDSSNPSNLRIWWGCYLAGSIAGNFSYKLDNGSILSPAAGATAISIISSILLIASAIKLRKIIVTVTDAQHTTMGVGEAFA